jgi:glycine/D-amino acid oxidase-like deaminating enzyme
MPRLSRRELLAGLLGASAGLLAGCEGRSASLPPAGEILSPNYAVGHRIRDGFRPRPANDRWQETDVVIIGGGVSGLAAAWALKRSGLERFVILELEGAPGGTSRSGHSPLTGYPWGAHYVPVPLPENRSLIALLREMGVIERVDAAGVPVVAEQYLCRDPGERVFVDGTWYEGLYPSAGATPRDFDELRDFRAEIARWVQWRDGKGRRAFAIPVPHGSDDPEVTALDGLSMAEWVRRHGWTSARLLWLIDYSCRDDYGATSEQASAWAGLFYFASRVRGPASESQSLITWPEGNGRIVRYLADRVRGQLRCGMAVVDVAQTRIHDAGRVEVTALDATTGEIVGIRAQRAIFAGSQFLAPYLIRDLPDERKRHAREFQYSPWLVANLHLRARPAERGFPLAWDNVLYDSRSLGYVTATHQAGLDYGPTVLTWYSALCDGPSGDAPHDSARQTAAARQRLLDMTWAEAAELVLSDLEPAHPEIRSLVERLDVMKWGHAMVRPRPGFVWSAARRSAAEPFGSIHFAGTDLSGVALCEEAVYHGVRAAEETLRGLGRSVQSLLSPTS